MSVLTNDDHPYDRPCDRHDPRALYACVRAVWV